MITGAIRRTLETNARQDSGDVVLAAARSGKIDQVPANHLQGEAHLNAFPTRKKNEQTVKKQGKGLNKK